jgi:hypothetical protein
LATVERAVRLISEGALDRAPVEVLAASLGVGHDIYPDYSTSISACTSVPPPKFGGRSGTDRNLGIKSKRAPTGRAVTLLQDSLSQLQANLFTECLVTNP